MGNTRKPKAVAVAVSNAKSLGGSLQRAAKARKKASARENKVKVNILKRGRQLDAALMALKKTDVGSRQAREVERAARAALKELLLQRKKLRKAQKAHRRAAAKERQAKGGAAAAAEKKLRATVPARRRPKSRPAKRRAAAQAARAKSTAIAPAAATMPSAAADKDTDTGEFPGSAGAPDSDLK